MWKNNGPQPSKSSSKRPDYAKQLLASMGLPEKGNLAIARESIAVEAKYSGITEQQAFVLIKKAAQSYAKAHEKVNAFWFQDAKWRESVPYIMVRHEREHGKPFPTGWFKDTERANV